MLFADDPVTVPIPHPAVGGMTLGPAQSRDAGPRRK